MPAAVFTHLLVPVDLSRKNERALATALQLATQNGARVSLLHVIQRIGDIPPSELRGFYRRLEKRAAAILARAARRFAAQNVRVRAAVLTGSPAHEIVRFAAANRVDLILLTSHKVDLARPRQGWGTTSYRVGILCQCPVMLVK
jgi:universal stress protein A